MGGKEWYIENNVSVRMYLSVCPSTYLSGQLSSACVFIWVCLLVFIMLQALQSFQLGLSADKLYRSSQTTTDKKYSQFILMLPHILFMLIIFCRLCCFKIFWAHSTVTYVGYYTKWCYLCRVSLGYLWLYLVVVSMCICLDKSYGHLLLPLSKRYKYPLCHKMVFENLSLYKNSKGNPWIFQ
jgi:hypothetical protein